MCPGRRRSWEGGVSGCGWEECCTEETYNTQTTGGFLFAVASGVLVPLRAIVSLCAGSLSSAMVVVLLVKVSL